MSVKPCSGHFSTGNFGNQPLMQDGSATPVTSPVAAATTLTVPDGAVRFHVFTTGGTTTVQIYSDTDGSSGADGAGTVVLPADKEGVFDCAGMGAGNKEYGNQFRVTPSVGNTYFWFDLAERN